MYEKKLPILCFFEDQPCFLTTAAQKKIVQWMYHVINTHNFSLTFLNIIFGTDQTLIKKNIQYLQHDTWTDVITFDLAHTQKNIAGDIYISITRVKENASIFSCTLQEELLRVIIHGLLHLLGYQDKNEILKKKMQAKEDLYLSIWEKKYTSTIFFNKIL